MKTRDYAFDNAKFILIVLVVFAHLLEISKGYGYSSNIYRIIYSFYMPLFVFLAGYFAKFNRRKVFTLIILYLIFQVIYIKYMNRIFDKDTKIQYTTPFWLLYFLLAYVFYLFLVPFIDFKDDKYYFIKAAILFSITLYFYFNFPKDKTQGYYLTVSRFVTFLPFFVLGFYTKKLLNTYILMTLKTNKR